MGANWSPGQESCVGNAFFELPLADSASIDGVFRRHHVGNDPVNGVDPTGTEADNGASSSSKHSTPCTGSIIPGGPCPSFLSVIGGRTNAAINHATEEAQEQRVGAVESIGDTAELADRMATIVAMGREGEALARDTALKDGYLIVGEQVYARTQLGLRVIDILATKGGQLFALEVKVNGSPYRTIQRMKDESMEKHGAIIRSMRPLAGGYGRGDLIQPHTQLLYIYLRPGIF